MQISENEYVVSLVTLNQGAAVELFDNELKKVLDNIADPQTAAEITREIKLSVKIKPSESRQQAAVQLKIESKCAPQKPASSSVWFGRVEGERVAVQTDPNQGKLFDKPDGKVIPMEKEVRA